jgi:hypothetical protein
MKLSGPMIAHLARYYPDGADVMASPVEGQVHVTRLDRTGGALVGGELDSEPGMAGGIGMTRSAFMRMAAEHREREEP